MQTTNETDSVQLSDCPDRFLDKKQVIEMVGLSYGTINNRMKDGKFPKSRRIGKKRVAWLQSEIIAWIQSCPVADPSDVFAPNRKAEG